MRYSSVDCPVCGLRFSENDDIVVCPVCGAPQHRECYTAAGKCCFAEKHAEGFEWAAPAPEYPAPEPQSPAEAAPAFANGESVCICPRCGGKCFSADTYCLKCGQKLDEAYFGVDSEPDRIGISESLRRFGGVDPKTPVCGMTAGELSIYVGGKKPGKTIRRLVVMERAGRKVSFPFVRIVLGPVWYLYKKLYKEGVLFALAVVATALISTLLQLNPAYIAYLKRQTAETTALTQEFTSGSINMSEFYSKLGEVGDPDLYEQELNELPTYWSVLSTAGSLLNTGIYALWFLGAMFGDRFYMKKIRADVSALRSKGLGGDKYYAALAEAGGGSPGGVVLGIALLTLMEFLPNLIVLFVGM